MNPTNLDAIHRLEHRARELRRGRPVDPETQRQKERVADGLRVTGDVIKWIRTREGLGEDRRLAGLAMQPAGPTSLVECNSRGDK